MRFIEIPKIDDLTDAILIIECGNASSIDALYAWEYIASTGAHRGLQGFYGRTVARLKEEGILDENGKVTPRALAIFQ